MLGPGKSNTPISVSTEPGPKRFEAIGFIALTGLLAHGLYIFNLTFFWDEWNYLFLYLNKGTEGVIEAMGARRASVAYLTAFLMEVLGPTPWMWQLFAFFLMTGTGVLAYFIVLRLAPGRNLEAVAAGLLFVVFPENHFYPLGLFSSVIYLSYFMTAASLYFTMLGLQTSNRRRTYIYTAAAIACAMVMAIGYEVFWGFEALRVLLIFYILREKSFGRSLIRRGLKTLLWWLPYLLTVAPYLIWRVFFFESQKDLANAGKHLSNFAQAPMTFLLSAGRKAYYSLIDCLAVAWGQSPLDVSSRNEALSVYLGMAAGLLTAGVVIFFLRRSLQNRGQEEQVEHPFLSGMLLGALGLSAVGFLNNTTNGVKLTLLAASALIGMLIWLRQEARQAKNQNENLLLRAALFWARFYAGVGLVFFMVLPYRYQGLETSFVFKVVLVSCVGTTFCILIGGAAIRLGTKLGLSPPNGRPLQLNLLWWGLAAFLAGIAVVLAAEKSATIREGPRYLIPAMLGSAIALAGVLFQVLGRRAGSALLALLLFGGVTANFVNTRYYYFSSRDLNSISWQLIWRVPDMKKHSVVVLKPFTNTHLATHIHISGLLAGLYGDPTLQGIILRDKHLQRGVQDILAQKKINTWLGKDLDLSRTLVVAGPREGRCLWLLDPPRLALAPSEDSQLAQVQAYSKARLVLTQRRAESPKNLIGAEPSRECWCFFFQKADLARHTRNWEEVVRLFEETKQMGLAPTDPREWLPFVQGLIETGRLQEAHNLAAQAYRMTEKDPAVKELLTRAMAELGIQ
jgi:hypothetical protein